MTSSQDASSILDWPLPQPSYDEVTTEREGQTEDQEVWSIYKGQTEENVATTCRNESQSADLFQELQREVERVLYTVSLIGRELVSEVFGQCSKFLATFPL